MRKLLKLFIVIALLYLPLNIVQGQGFAFFEPEGAVTKTLIKSRGEAKGIVETIVNDQVDLSNLKVKYKLLSRCNFADGELDADYTNSETVKIEKGGGDVRSWKINVMQLRPASLPLNISFSKSNPSIWNNSVNGWASWSLDAGKSQVARFGVEGAAFYVALDGPATKLEYELKVISDNDFDGVFVIETSDTGKKWKTLVEYNSSNIIKPGEMCTHSLNKNVRFVRWVYFQRNKQNINLNNISIY